MVNWDIVSIFIFYALLLVVYYRYKEKFSTQGLLVMYRTKLGLRWMDRLAKAYPRVVHWISYVGVVLGFAGMAFILYFLIKETIKLVFVPGTPPALAPVLPGIEIAGAPTLSFWHWIITIFIAAVIHEFSHGVVARLHDVPIKSSGFAFLGPILAAFVEPEEKELEKKSKMQQLSVFAAGPFSNMVLGVVIILVMFFVLGPLASAIYQGEGIIVNQVVEGYPMNATGIAVPFTILAVNGEETKDIVQFANITKDIAPGDSVVLTTDKGEFTVVPVENPENASKAFFGVSGFEAKVSLKEQYAYLEPYKGFFDWVQLLVLWIFIVTVGVGLFNLLPLGPVDGGRMFYTLALGVFKKEAYAKRALQLATVLCLVLIFINMIPWLNKLFLWLWGLFSVLLGLL